MRCWIFVCLIAYPLFPSGSRSSSALNFGHATHAQGEHAQWNPPDFSDMEYPHREDAPGCMPPHLDEKGLLGHPHGDERYTNTVILRNVCLKQVG